MLTLEDDDDELPNESLPTPFADVRRQTGRGEPSLWLAVLRAAIVALDRGAKGQAFDVWAWVASDDESVGSFAFICAVLGLEAEVWRPALLRMPRRPRGRPTVKRCADCQRKRWACKHWPVVAPMPPVPEPMQAMA